MKSRNFWKWSLGLGLAVLPFAGGCLQDNPPPPVQSAAAITTATEAPLAYEPSLAESNPTKAEPLAGPSTLSNLAEAAVEPISTNQPAPPKVNLMPAAAELVKMANAGVDEQVMLAFVTNSPSTFNLGAEEIIYLNDLGVPGAVVTAMIQRDKVLQEAGAAAMAASAQANTPQQVPEPEQPAPSEVAPQQTAPPVATAEAVAPPPATEVTTATFYDSLAPYGTWVFVAGYGSCWRPTIAVVSPGWAPYYDGGRWVYTDWGWYWVSDYSWGWAPFHYGRWFRHASWGWCWAPDTVWGPCWVAWRYSNAYCGWAPLPPGACFSFSFGLTYYGRRCYDWNDCGLGPHHAHFVAWRDFDRHGFHGHELNGNARTVAYRESSPVNNFALRNSAVINRGVPRDRVEVATHRTVREVRIHETRDPAVLRAGGRTEQLRGDTLTVYRPPREQVTRNEGGYGRTGSTRSLPEMERNSVAGAPVAESSMPARRAESVVERNAGFPERIQTPAIPSRQPSVAPAVRQPAANTSIGTVPTYRSAPPAVSRTPAATPSRAPSFERAPQPVPSRPPAVSTPQNSGTAPRSTPVPARSEPVTRPQSPPPSPAPSRTPSQQSPRTSYVPSSRSTPAYTASQRSYTARSQTTQQRLAITPPSISQRQTASTPQQSYSAPQVPRYTPYTAVPAQVPRYTPTYSRPSYNPQSPSTYRSAPTYSRPAPSYSRPAPSGLQAPRYSAPAAPAISAPSTAPAVSRPAPSVSRPAPSGQGGGRQR